MDVRKRCSAKRSAKSPPFRSASIRIRLTVSRLRTSRSSWPIPMIAAWALEASFVHGRPGRLAASRDPERIAELRKKSRREIGLSRGIHGSLAESNPGCKGAARVLGYPPAHGTNPEQDLLHRRSERADSVPRARARRAALPRGRDRGASPTGRGARRD